MKRPTYRDRRGQGHFLLLYVKVTEKNQRRSANAWSTSGAANDPSGFKF
jgi:hypothetical protein